MKKATADSRLLGEIRKYGHFDPNGCFNCGSCTLTCALTEDFASFPRRSMQYGLLGLKGPLHAGLEPWLCYYCGDCSTACPRQAEPGEGLMTLRRYLSAQYDCTGLAAKISASAAWRIGAIFFAGLLVFLLFLFYHLYYTPLSTKELFSTSMGLEHMLGSKLTYFTYALYLIPLFLLISNALRMFLYTRPEEEEIKIPAFLYLAELKTFVIQALTQQRYRQCAEKNRWLKHFLLFSGFVLMAVILIFFLKWFQTDKLYPLAHPQRWLGYIAAFLLIYGSVEFLRGRIKKGEPVYKFSQLGDWTLPGLILLTALSGLAVHFFRYTNQGMAAHYAYLVHLIIAAPLLLVEIPFGKLSHMLYRPLAVYLQQVRVRAHELAKEEPGLAGVKIVDSIQ